MRAMIREGHTPWRLWLGVLAVGLLVCTAQANVIRTFPTCESFELKSAGAALVGSDGWYGTDPLGLTVKVTSGTPASTPVFPAAAHTRDAGFNAQVTMPLQNTAGHARSYTEFLVKPVLGDQPLIATTNILDWAFYFNSSGRIVINHGNYTWSSPGTGYMPIIREWTAFTNAPVSTSQWVRIRVTVDFTSFAFGPDAYMPCFQVSLNGTPLTHAKGFPSPTGFTPPPPGGSWFFALDIDNPDHDWPDYGYFPAGFTSGFGMQGFGRVDDVFIHSSTNVPAYSLALSSTYGGAKGSPAVPSSPSYPYGSTVVCSITNSPVVMGATQVVCTGWINGTGTVPPTGASTSVAVTVNTNSALRWNWKTQYRLTTAAGAGGTVAPATGWYDLGASVQLNATADGGMTFRGWTGDVPAAQTNQNPLTLTMDRGRAVTALFSDPSALYTTRGIPYTWLASYGITNNQEVAQNLDPDKDGAPTWAEYVAGTVPTSSNSVFALLSTEKVGALNRVTWYGTTDSGVTTGFGMYLSTNLQTWALIIPGGTLPRAGSGTNVWTDPTPRPGPAHYRPMIPWDP